MIKYELLPDQLLHEGTCSEQNFFQPGFPSMDQISGVHTDFYIHRLLNLELDASEVRKIGFPLSQELVDRELIIAAGTIRAVEYARENGISMNIAGGTHHAFSDKGEAFCLLNDQAIGAQYLLDEGKAERILIVDLDVHQGNGTAEIFRDRPEVYTFSMHGASNYPFKKERSDLDIELKRGTDDSTYLSILQNQLPNLIDQVQPDFVFYLCGVDVVETDKLGTLSLSLNGCKERDRFVLETCQRHGIPVQCSMGGGYSPDIRLVVEAHSNTFRLAQELFF